MLITAAAATFAAAFLATLAILWPKTQRETLQPVRPLRKAYTAPRTLFGRPVGHQNEAYWSITDEVENDPVYEDGVLVGYKRR